MQEAFNSAGTRWRPPPPPVPCTAPIAPAPSEGEAIVARGRVDVRNCESSRRFAARIVKKEQRPPTSFTRLLFYPVLAGCVAMSFYESNGILAKIPGALISRGLDTLPPPSDGQPAEMFALLTRQSAACASPTSCPVAGTTRAELPDRQSSQRRRSSQQAPHCLPKGKPALGLSRPGRRLRPRRSPGPAALVGH